MTETSNPAADALQTKPDFLAAILNTAGALILVIDRQGRIVRFNKSCQRTTGYSFEEVKGRPFWDLLIPPEQVAVVKKVFQNLKAGQFPNEHENYWLTKNGERRLIAWSNTALFDEDGTVDYVVATGLDITERKQAEEQLRQAHDELEDRVAERTADLRRHVAFEDLITTISTNFINLTLEEIDQGINQALRKVGQFMGVDRSYVFLFSDDSQKGGRKMNNTHEWCAEGIAPQRQRMQDIPVDTLPWSNQILMQGEVLHISKVTDLPPEASSERQEFQAQGTQSLIAVPMVYQGQTMGLVGFDAVRGEKTWSEDSIKLLKMLGAIFVNALERKRADAALRESRRMLSTLISNLPGMAYRCRVDPNWTMEFVSEGSLELTGYPPEALIDNHAITYGELIHPADRRRVHEAVRKALDDESSFQVTYRLNTPAGEKWVWEQGQRVHTQDDDSTAVEGFITDITERVSARRNLEQRVKERTRELSTLLEISHNVASTLELEPLLGLILDQLGAVLAYDAASMMILDQDRLDVLAYRGPIPQAEALQLSFPVGQAGANRTVIQRQEPVIIDDVRGEEPLARALQETAGEELYTTYGYLRCWMGVPLIVKDQVVGMLTLDHCDPGYYSSQHADLAMTFANQVAVAIENARLYQAEQERLEESERRRKVAEGLRDIVSILNSNCSLEEVLDAIVVQALQLLHADGGAIYQLDAEQEMIDIVTTHSMPSGFAQIRSFPIAPTAVNRSIFQRRPFAVPDFSAMEPSTDPAQLPSSLQDLTTMVSQHFRASLTVPVVVEEQLYGAISLYYNQPRQFSGEEVELSETFAHQAALAIANARLRDQVEEVAVAAERSRLARDLHDAVTQTLFSASLIADVLPKIWEVNPEEGWQRLEELRELTRGALAEMRTLLLELRPAALADAELKELLQQLAESVTGRARVPVSLEVTGDCHPDEEVKVALYRIAQEALNNVAKHAGASQAQVCLHCGPDWIDLCITDDGRGFDVSTIPPDHLGVGIMRERAEAIGAELTIESEPGRGTEVMVSWQAS
jgi:PAS domain S-box-containing protein